MLRQQEEEEEKSSPASILFFSVVMIGFFATCASLLAFVAIKCINTWWLYRHGHHTEATIHAKRGARIRSPPESTRPQATMGLVNLVYSVPRNKYESAVSALDEREEEETTTVENPKWIVLPHALRDKASNDTVSILVHPTDPLEIQFRVDFNMLLIPMTIFMLVVFGMSIFFAFLGCWSLSELDLPSLPHARESSMALLVGIDTGIFVYFVRKAQARSLQHPSDGYAAVVVFREAIGDPECEDEPAGSTSKETVELGASKTPMQDASAL